MKKNGLKSRYSVFVATLAFILVVSSLGFAATPAFAQDGSIDSSDESEEGQVQVINPYYSEQQITASNGDLLTAEIIDGPATPPAGFVPQKLGVLPASAVTLSNVPAYSWVFGCSAVSGSMIAGYYDRTGYSNMYTGSTNSGVTPLADTGWATWSDGSETYPNNPLVASHNGVDGRTTKGSIDDYWLQYESTASDPYITGNWTAHTWGTAIGDYMKTSQSAYNNTDGSTHFYTYTSSASKLSCSDMVSGGISTLDGTYGRKLFYEARGYTVTDCYNQKTDNNISGGFSFADYKAEIDAGHPVMINVVGHTMVGMGYDDASQTVYLHDTWGNYTTNMTWGGSYSNMAMLSVSIVNLAPLATVPTLTAPTGTISTLTPTFQWTTVPGATQYEYQVLSGSTVVEDNTVSSSACSGSSCSDTPTTTLNNGSYTWKARAYTTAWQNYSATTSFTVSVSTVPTLVAPTGTVNTASPAFQWTPVTGATQYELQVLSGTNVVLDSTISSIIEHCTATLCSYTPTATLADGAYTWKARANTTAWQAYSGSTSFTVSTNLVPTLVAPTGTISIGNPTFEWTPISGATQYEYQVLSGSSVLVDQISPASICSSTSCSDTIAFNLSNGPYTWKARAYTTAWQDYSATSDFTIAVPAIPTLQSPTGTVNTATPTYQWTPINDGDEYELQVLSGSSTVIDETISDSYCSTTSCSYTPATSLNNGAYTWKVRGHDYTWEDFSATSSFTVSVNSLPTLLPMGSVIDTTPRFHWTPVSGATKYEIRVYNDAMIVVNDSVSSSACTTTSCAWTITKALPYGAYFWMVRGYTTSWQDFSKSSSFTLMSTTAGKPFTFYFNDDAPNWSSVTGSWSVSNGSYHSTGASDNYNASSAHDGNYSTLDFIAPMKTTGDGWSMLIFRGDSTSIEPNWWDWENAYYFACDATTGRYAIYKRVDGNLTFLVSWTDTTYLKSGNWNTLEVKAKGTDMQFFINSQLVAYGSDSAFASGQVGLGTWNHADGFMFYADAASLSTSVTLSSTAETAGVATFHPRSATAAELKEMHP